MVLILLVIVCGLLILLAVKERGQLKIIYATSALLIFFIMTFFLFDHIKEEKKKRALVTSPPQIVLEPQAPLDITNTDNEFSYNDLEAISFELYRQLSQTEQQVESLQQRLDAKREFILENWDSEQPAFINENN
ncbi:hypothetical protein L4D09_09275 [Photobacterium makurazakiensis]|uniref:hypothetical protein n=1 Tax=Photobacterium makurazakiensis TaxID=2910234 RepID=UPI003D11BD31